LSTNFQAFGSVANDGDQCYYSIVNRSAAEWELGVGTYVASGDHLTRTLVLASSNGNAVVTFSAGTKDVSLIPTPKEVITAAFALGGTTAASAASIGVGVLGSVFDGASAYLPQSMLSSDGTLAHNSDNEIPTMKAVKTYADAHGGGGLTPDGVTLDTSGAGGTLEVKHGGIGSAQMAQLPAHSYLGNYTGEIANVAGVTAAQLAADLPAVVGDTGTGGTKGLVPAPGAGDATAEKFLGAGGTFSVPTGKGQFASINAAFNGGGSALVAPLECEIRVPFAGTIVEATLLADQAGSAVVDIWKAALASYPPLVANSICASDLPTLTSADHETDTTLTGWTVAFNAGDVLKFHLSSSATITRLEVFLKVQKS
jgi:hypothetical protein